MRKAHSLMVEERKNVHEKHAQKRRLLGLPEESKLPTKKSCLERLGEAKSKSRESCLKSGKEQAKKRHSQYMRQKAIKCSMQHQLRSVAAAGKEAKLDRKSALAKLVAERKKRMLKK